MPARKPRKKTDARTASATAAPVFFGPERPPAAAPRQSTSTPQSTGHHDNDDSGNNTVPAAIAISDQDAQAARVNIATGSAAAATSTGGTKSKRRRKPKQTVPTCTGWEQGYRDPKPHVQDVNRYDPTLPYEQRMLRAIDEWRSLRKLTSDQALNVRWMLMHLDFNVSALLKQYGPQSLCGVLPDEPDEYKDPDSEDSDNDDDDETGSTDTDDNRNKFQEVDEVQQQILEDEWAHNSFDEGAVATWLHARFNDFYTPTLAVAPQVFSNFVRFLLLRNVLPRHKHKLEAIGPILEIAQIQLPMVGPFAKQFPTPLMESINCLWSDLSQSIPVPFENSNSNSTEPATIPQLIPSTDFVDETTDLGLDEDTQVLSVDGWNIDDDLNEDDPTQIQEVRKKLLDQVQKLQAMNKKLQVEHHQQELWKSTTIHHFQALSNFKQVLIHLGFDFEKNKGHWKIELEERSVRQIQGWKLLKPVHQTLIRAESDTRHVMRLQLSSHEHDFPLTAYSHRINKSNDNDEYNNDKNEQMSSLYKSVDILLDLTTTCITSYLIKNVFIESDLVKLVFKPLLNQKNSSTTTMNHNDDIPIVLWIPKTIYRILPSYWNKIDSTELRDEPSKQRDFEPGWIVPDDERTARIQESFERYRVKDDDDKVETDQHEQMT
ncbi:hypothetical protein OIO90_002324 [Microbotryomycetes sp. JL221]|nr:hypothetical protein OIO90_002324 [Microbotryomycetes sp. JL221]